MFSRKSNQRLVWSGEEEVINYDKLYNVLAVSKSLVDSLNTKYTEAMEQVTKSAKTFAEHDKTSKGLKKNKDEIGRLTKKSEESLKTISKLCPSRKV